MDGQLSNYTIHKTKSGHTWPSTLKTLHFHLPVRLLWLVLDFWVTFEYERSQYFYEHFCWIFMNFDVSVLQKFCWNFWFSKVHLTFRFLNFGIFIFSNPKIFLEFENIFRFSKTRSESQKFSKTRRQRKTGRDNNMTGNDTETEPVRWPMTLTVIAWN